MPEEVGISVIMSCYNSSFYMEEAIESVLNQSLEDFELILIDDFSVDNTSAICNYYKKQDKRIRVVPLPINSGPASARNAGIKLARGEWIAVLDYDDLPVAGAFCRTNKASQIKQEFNIN